MIIGSRSENEVERFEQQFQAALALGIDNAKTWLRDRNFLCSTCLACGEVSHLGPPPKLAGLPRGELIQRALKEFGMVRCDFCHAWGRFRLDEDGDSLVMG